MGKLTVIRQILQLTSTAFFIYGAGRMLLLCNFLVIIFRIIFHGFLQSPNPFEKILCYNELAFFARKE
jgi:hypothetical protein